MLNSFWGKTGIAVDGNLEWHPAICHMVDTGAVACALLETCLPRPMVDRVSDPLNLPPEQARRFLAFLIAAHDVGKISAGFQHKVPSLAKRLPEPYCRSPYGGETDHTKIGCRYLSRWLLDKMDISGIAADDVGRMLAGHHGGFPGDCDDAYERGSRQAWDGARHSALDALRELFLFDRVAFRTNDEHLPAGWIMALAGLTSVADWLASDSNFFSYEASVKVKAGREDLGDYLTRWAMPSAEKAIARLHWTHSGNSERKDGPDFGALFVDQSGKPLAPRPMQSLCHEYARGSDHPFLLLVEAPMGLGKTEAALWAAETARMRMGQSGMYFALPTQATSNQMFSRLNDFLERARGREVVPLHLLHGMADLNEVFAELKRAGRNLEDSSPIMPRALSGVDGASGAVIAQEWFCGRKRGLLSPYAVGTIDQALLSVLTVRHFFVRLFALANKTVIIDEVHAYDTYMSKLLDRLLVWLRELGSSVILLSATLPEKRRRELIAAYTGHDPPLDLAVYPRIVYASLEGEDVHAIIVDGGDRKTVRFTAGPVDRSVSDVLAERLAHGGVAAVIANTVGQAQRLYMQIRRDTRFRDLASSGDLTLFHARFPVEDRLRIERIVLDRFGKDGANRPRRAIVVATQVIEQSLDLDFDFMVSDLAPVDLLLQRAGRLHRHVRPRPPGLDDPQFVWLLPEIGEDGVPLWGANGFIYEPYVLLRTWLWLRDRTQIIIPDEMETWIEAVYGETSDASLLSPALERERAIAFEELTRKRKADAAAAADFMLADPRHPDGVLNAVELTPEDSDKAQKLTRLADPTITIVCAHRTPAGIALDREGTDLLPDGVPTWSQIRRLLQRSVKIGVRTWYGKAVLNADGTPKSWESVPLLRQCRIAVFHEGKMSVGKRILRLDPELGLYDETMANRQKGEG